MLLVLVLTLLDPGAQQLFLGTVHAGRDRHARRVEPRTHLADLRVNEIHRTVRRRNLPRYAGGFLTHHRDGRVDPLGSLGMPPVRGLLHTGQQTPR